MRGEAEWSPQKYVGIISQYLVYKAADKGVYVCVHLIQSAVQFSVQI